jgi:aspartate aminotransferase-like enzyme
MEASILNGIQDCILICINGSFGKRYADIAKAYGKKIIILEPSLGMPIKEDDLETALKKHPEVEAVALTHNETSTGLINPLKELASIVNDHEKLLFVDAVSSMGGVPIKIDDWGIDICFSSSQKCFGVPPGLGIGSVSPRVLKKSESISNKGWYFDLKIWQSYHEQGRGTPMTSAIPQVSGLHAALKMIEENGGKNWYFKLYQNRNKKIRKGLEKMELGLFPKKGYESYTVSCIYSPSGIESPMNVYEAMRKKGFELAQGYGTLKKKTFRIGNMGYIKSEYIDEMLESLSQITSHI